MLSGRILDMHEKKCDAITLDAVTMHTVSHQFSYLVHNVCHEFRCCDYTVSHQFNYLVYNVCHQFSLLMRRHC